MFIDFAHSHSDSDQESIENFFVIYKNKHFKMIIKLVLGKFSSFGIFFLNINFHEVVEECRKKDLSKVEQDFA